MNLAVTHNGLSLPVESYSEKVFQSPKVARIPEQSLLEFLIDQLSLTFYKCGQTFAKDNNQEIQAKECIAMAENLKQEIAKNYKWLTVKELEIIFSEGIKDRYGKSYGLNIRTFLRWIETFNTEHRNKELIDRKEVKKPKKEKELTAEEKQLIVINGIFRAFDYYNKHTQIALGRIYVYEELYSLKLLPKHTPEYKKTIKLQAQKAIKEEIETNVIGRTQRVKNIIKGIYDPGELNTKCKELILKEYFQKVIDSDQDFEQIIYNAYRQQNK